MHHSWNGNGFHTEECQNCGGHVVETFRHKGEWVCESCLEGLLDAEYEAQTDGIEPPERAFTTCPVCDGRGYTATGVLSGPCGGCAGTGERRTLPSG